MRLRGAIHANARDLVSERHDCPDDGGDLPAIQRQPTGRRTLKLGLDAGTLASVVVAVATAGGPVGWTATVVLLCLTILAISGQYRVLAASLGEDLRSAVAVSAVSTIAAAALATVASQVLAVTDVVTLWLVTVAVLAAVRLLLAGLDARRWLRGAGRRRVLIIGAGRVSRVAARRLAERPGLGLEPTGFLDLDPLEGGEHDPRVLGSSWDLDRVVREHRIDSVLIGFSTAPHQVLLRIVHRCWDLGLEVMVVPRLFEVQGLRSYTRHVGGLPLVSIGRSSSGGLPLSLKEAVDRGVALLLLVILAPLLGVTAVAVGLTSPGSVLYRAPRIGKEGRPFEMLKFRTMHGDPQVRGEHDADWAAESLRAIDGSAGGIALLIAATTDKNPQTSIGWLLRRTALDELPQLWNVVRGEMALVGPRPERVAFARLFATRIYRYQDRHRVRPGITGWAQVQGLRGKTSLRDRVEWDNFYIENWSFWFDIKILALTVIALLRT